MSLDIELVDRQACGCISNYGLTWVARRAWACLIASEHTGAHGASSCVGTSGRLLGVLAGASARAGARRWYLQAVCTRGSMCHELHNRRRAPLSSLMLSLRLVKQQALLRARPVCASLSGAL